MTADRAERVRRRRVLTVLGSAAVVGTAGCLGGDGEENDGTPNGDADDGSTSEAASPAGTGSGAQGDSELLPSPSLGADDADVTVAVYKDFACPHCATFAAEMKPQIVDEYVNEGTVRLVHHDFPIPVDDTESWRAANAARAVQVEADDEAFHAYADRLFETQPTLGLDTYAELADEVPGETVRAAASDQTYQATVEADRENGIDRGVKGTPTVFVDGDKTDGWDWESIESAIENARSG